MRGASEGSGRAAWAHRVSLPLPPSGIRDGAAKVRKLIEDTINPGYLRSAYHITWAVTVQTQKKTPFHLGRQFMERPVVSVYALRSPNAEGVMTDWVLPPELLSGVLVQGPASPAGGDGGDDVVKVVRA